MSVTIDNRRGKKVAELLYNSFSTTGIHGRIDMPEDITPNNVVRGSLGHIFFITLTVSIDYQRDAPSLWESSRKTFNDPETRYLFDPKLLHETSFNRIVVDMQNMDCQRNLKKMLIFGGQLVLRFIKNGMVIHATFFKIAIGILLLFWHA